MHLGLQGGVFLVETSPLISLLKIARADLLAVYGPRPTCTDSVRAEVTKQKEALDQTIEDGLLSEFRITNANQLERIECLRSGPPSLGAGEASSIILAEALCVTLLIDDRNARKAALDLGIHIRSTAELLVTVEECGLANAEQINEILKKWADVQEFAVNSKSFTELKHEAHEKEESARIVADGEDICASARRQTEEYIERLRNQARQPRRNDHG